MADLSGRVNAYDAKEFSLKMCRELRDMCAGNGVTVEMLSGASLLTPPEIEDVFAGNDATLHYYAWVYATFQKLVCSEQALANLKAHPQSEVDSIFDTLVSAQGALSDALGAHLEFVEDLRDEPWSEFGGTSTCLGEVQWAFEDGDIEWAEQAGEVLYRRTSGGVSLFNLDFGTGADAWVVFSNANKVGEDAR